MGQQGLIPVAGIGQLAVEAKGLVDGTHVHDECGEVAGAGHVAVQDVILHEAAQRVHAVGEILKAMAGSIDILGIDLVVDLACQVVEGTQIAIARRDTILLELGPID